MTDSLPFVRVLMVAEKPSIADTITRALCGRESAVHRSGLSSATSVHTYRGYFKGNVAEFRVTSTVGHIFNLNFPGALNNWKETPPETLFGGATVKEEANSKTRIPAHLAKEAEGCSHLVLWLDADREGENICFEVIDCVASKLAAKGRNSRPAISGPQQQIWRARFSSLVDKDIRHAMANLVSPNENEAKAVDCRQELDLKIGCAFTRFQTTHFHDKFAGLDSKLVSYGPCQTPTLFFCVERADAIAQFQPETFHKLDVEVSHKDVTFSVDWRRGRLFDHGAVQVFKDLLDEAGFLETTSVGSHRKNLQRPLPLNTVALLKQASSLLGLSPQQAMHIAESLYLRRFVTYPRTETTAYAANFEFKELVKAQEANSELRLAAQNMLSKSSDGVLVQPRKGVDAGDHPPITPTSVVPDDGALSGDERRLYNLIARHFLATLSGDCILEATRIDFCSIGEHFSIEGSKLIEKGYTAVALSRDAPPDRELPKLQKGDLVKIVQSSISQGQTKPPGYLSESDLLGLMESHGIGTDASMPTHIQNICTRNYVELIPGGRLLKPTKLGLALIHGTRAVDPELVLPAVRANIESQCALIAKGLAQKEAVVNHCLTIFHGKFNYFAQNIGIVDHLFSLTFQTVSEAGEPFSKCGRCNKYMKLVRSSKPPRLLCATCQSVYNLPLQGTLKLYSGLTCPLDDFELLLSSIRGQNIPLCPMCFNDPPFETTLPRSETQNVFGGVTMNCLQCRHPTCKHSVTRQGVALCSQPQCNGVLCLDVLSGPKWKFCCNSCNFQLHLPDIVHKIQVLADQVCEECSSSEVKVQFHKEKAKEKDQLDIQGCLVCSPEINELLQGIFANFRRRGGGARGRGGRFRRRGRGKNVDPKMTFDRF